MAVATDPAGVRKLSDVPAPHRRTARRGVVGTFLGYAILIFFSLVFLFGAPHALRVGAHVRVDVIYGGHPPRVRAWIDLLGGLLLLIPFSFVTVWLCRDFVRDSWLQREVSSDPGGLPRWPLKAVVPPAFLLLALQGASEVVKRVALLRGVVDGTAREPTEPGAL